MKREKYSYKNYLNVKFVVMCIFISVKMESKIFELCTQNTYKCMNMQVYIQV